MRTALRCTHSSAPLPAQKKGPNKGSPPIERHDPRANSPPSKEDRPLLRKQGFRGDGSSLISRAACARDVVEFDPRGRGCRDGACRSFTPCLEPRSASLCWEQIANRTAARAILMFPTSFPERKAVASDAARASWWTLIALALGAAVASAGGRAGVREADIRSTLATTRSDVRR